MNIIVAILALGLLIVLHEAGHYFAARWCGMKVYEFSIGFGPRIWFFQHGETEFSIRAIFLGGYVRVAGMHPAEEDVDDEGSFLKSAPWKRFTMIVAGPIANYLTAIALFFFIFGGWGTRDNQLLLKRVDAQKASSATGLLAGDRILAINGMSIVDRMPKTTRYSFWELFQKLAPAAKGVTLTISRAGQKHTVQFPKISIQKIASTKLGIQVQNTYLTTVRQVAPKSVAARAGIVLGDHIVSVGKKSLKDPFQFLRKIKMADKAFDFQVMRKGKQVSLKWPAASKKQSPSKGLQLKKTASLHIQKIKAGSLAQAAGLLEGDRILSVGKNVLENIEAQSSYAQVHSLLAECHTAKKPLSIDVLRNQKKTTLTLKKSKSSCAAGLVFRPTIRIFVQQSLPKSVAAAMGLKAGDQIVAVDGQEVSGFYHMLALFRHRIYRSIKVTVLRAGKRVGLTAPMAKKANGWKLGFKPQLDFPRKRATLLAALRNAVVETWTWNVRIYSGLAKIFKGREKMQFTGPVGIVRMAQQTVKQGLNYFLIFVAVISIHLAFFNLLPIPALDGGRLMFLFTQQILRLFGGKEEVGVRIEMVANLIGFFLLLGLLLFITFKDIVSWVR